MHEFHVPAMTCGHCVRAVTDAVKAIDPQAQVDIDLPSHTVKVQTQQPRDALVRALAEADYPPS